MTAAPTPARALRDRAESLLRPGQEFAFATDANSQEGVVLIAIAKPAWCGVFSISKAEYGLDGAIALANLLGFQQEESRHGPPPMSAGKTQRKRETA
jgi:hypothetical protein